MNINKMNIMAVIGLMVIMTCSSSTVFAAEEETYATDQLHFGLDTARVFIAGTTNDADTVAQIGFSLKFDSAYIADSIGIGTISTVIFKFWYPANSLTLDTFYTSENWGGIIDTLEHRISGDSGIVKFRLFNDNLTPPDEYTILAYVEFKACCPMGDNPDSLIFFGSNSENRVEIGTDVYKCDDLSDGWVGLNDYVVSYWISKDTLQGKLGDTIEVPVYWQNNFYVYHSVDFIVYDTLRLQYLDLIAADSSDWHHILVYASDDTVRPAFICLAQKDNYHADSTLFYTLRFIAKADDPWDGETANLTFDITWSYTKGIYPSGWFWPDSVNYSDGWVHMEEYEAEFSYYFTGDPITEGDSTTYVMINAAHNFAMGDLDTTGGETERTMMILDLCDDFKDADFEDGDTYEYSPDTVFKFDINEFHDTVRIRQVYDASLDNYRPLTETPTDLVKVRLWFDYGNYTPSFSNRFAKLCGFAEFYDGTNDTMQTFDTTGNVRLTQADGNLITIEGDSLEIMLGEFSTNEAHYTTKSSWPQEVYIRNTFDVDSFYVKVHVSSDYIEIDNLITYGDVQGSTVNDTCVILFCDSGDGPEANGDDSTMIACLQYGFDGGCQTGNVYEGDVSFTDAYIEDADGNEPFMLYDPKTTKGKCRALGITICPLPPGGNQTAPIDPAAEDVCLLPVKFSLHHNRPNPFNPRTTIAYEVPVVAHVRIDVYNILGQDIRTLVDEVMPTGVHEVIWDGTDENGHRVATGVYFYRMEAGDFRDSKKMILMK